MSRAWLAVYVGLLSRPKYRRLSIPARAALFHIWLLAGGQTPEATWSRDELADVLDLDGYPASVIDELLERRWLDVDDDDRLLVHDWDEHQLAASKAAQVDYERDRKADWRRRRQVHGTADPPPAPPPGTQQDITEQPSRSVPDTSGTRSGPSRPGVNATKRHLERLLTVQSPDGSFADNGVKRPVSA